jgi:hypothetical protein
VKISEIQVSSLVAEAALLGLKDRFGHIPLDRSMDPRRFIQIERIEGTRDYEWCVIAGALIQMYEQSTCREFTGASRRYDEEEFELTYRRKIPGSHASSAVALAQQLLWIDFPRHLSRECADRAHSVFSVHYRLPFEKDKTSGILVYGRVPPMMLSMLSANIRHFR